MFKDSVINFTGCTFLQFVIELSCNLQVVNKIFNIH